MMTTLLVLVLVTVMRNQMRQIKRGQLCKRVTVVVMDRRVSCIVLPLLCLFSLMQFLHIFALGRQQFAQSPPPHFWQVMAK